MCVFRLTCTHIHRQTDRKISRPTYFWYFRMKWRRREERGVVQCAAVP